MPASAPAGSGILWLGFVVYPTHRNVKARKVRSATKHHACVQGWINHVRYGDTWGWRKAMLARLARRAASRR